MSNKAKTSHSLLRDKNSLNLLVITNLLQSINKDGCISDNIMTSVQIQPASALKIHAFLCNHAQLNCNVSITPRLWYFRPCPWMLILIY